MTPSPTSESYIQAIIDWYDDDGNIDKALEKAEHDVYDLIRESGTGVPTVVILEAMELWMHWLVRMLAGTIAAVAVETIDGWDDERGEQFLNVQVVLSRLLREDALRTMIEMKVPGAIPESETDG
jgi:hypothetical protein